MQKTFNNMWVVVDPKGKYRYHTLSTTRHAAIIKLSAISHEKLMKVGYTCIPVNVTFEPVKKEGV